jgi:hypothetical protein
MSSHACRFSQEEPHVVTNDRQANRSRGHGTSFALPFGAILRRPRPYPVTHLKPGRPCFRTTRLRLGRRQGGCAGDADRSYAPHASPLRRDWPAYRRRFFRGSAVRISLRILSSGNSNFTRCGGSSGSAAWYLSRSSQISSAGVGQAEASHAKATMKLHRSE